MSTVAHSALTGASLHEPKGVELASAGQIYLSNGSGSGTWTTLATLTQTGMIADFSTPVAPSGWLELDGSDVSTTTYAALFAALTIQQVGTRNSSNPSAPKIQSLTSTTHMRPGYYVYGNGITAGTTIVSVNSGTEITVSQVMSTSTTENVIISPWYLGAGTIRLPNVSTSGRFRRSRTSSVHMGVSQADMVKGHTHTVSATGTSGTTGSTHAHNVSASGSGTTGSENQVHTHNVTSGQTGIYSAAGTSGTHGPSYGGGAASGEGFVSGNENEAHDHNFSVSVSGNTDTSGAHTHDLSVTGTAASDGSAENRPLSLVVMTCVKY